VQVTPDVLVIGGGPAGRALAAESAHRGLRTTLLDPAPDAPWRATYGAWVDDLPPDLPAATIATRGHGRAIALTERRLGWEYAVLDVPALREHLDTAMERAGVTVRIGRALGLAAASTVALADGTQVNAQVVVDAGGGRQPLAPTRRGVPAEQAAYGLLLDESVVEPLLAPGEALFMDWRPDHGEPGSPTFLYAVPLGGGSVLVEETSLAHRPGLPMPVLRRRLLARLARHGIVAPPGAADERVLFTVDSPRHRTRGVLGFGAAAPLVHPASGFSVATALTLAPAVAHALATRLPGGADTALAAARAVVWSPAARAVHRFRRIGLEAVLRMPPADLRAFFEVFFALPERQRWAYLTGRDDLRGTVATMNALFARADWTLRSRLIAPALLPRTAASDA
jgi:lycopene beta-cyclase